MNQPKVSVVIPIYQAEKYIEDTINSVLAQTYPNWELILVDDGSTDDSVAICRKFQNSKVTLISQGNGGVSAALNTGIRQATGEYLAFLDADDLWLPEKLAKHIKHLENNPSIGVSFSRSSFINEMGESFGSYTKPKLTNITPVDLLRANPLCNGSSAVIRRETLAEIKFIDRNSSNSEPWYFDEQIRVSQDVEYIMRVLLQTNWQIEGLAEPLTCYRIITNSNSSNWQKKFQDWTKFLERTRLYAPEFVNKWENLGRAYQLRYLARQTVHRKVRGSLAKELINRSLKTSLSILWEEPIATIKIIIAAYLLDILPDFYLKNINVKRERVSNVTKIQQ